MIIGIVGGICSGKSTISQMLVNKGYFYINADQIGHHLILPDGRAYMEVLNCFGNEILNNDKTIDRKKLGDIVFSDNNKLEMLNNITHKYIYNEIKMILNNLRYKSMFENELNIVVDAALLYEIRLDSLVDVVWYIDTKIDMQIDRLMERNGFTKSEAIARIKSQDIPKHMSRADKIIINDGNLMKLEEHINELIK